MAAKLRAVDPPGTKAPRPLGEHGTALWGRVQAEYHIVDAGGVELLSLACESLDRAEDCRARIDADGSVQQLDNGTFKEHALIKHELANRAFVSRCIARLGLDVEPVRAVGRPVPWGWSG